MQFSLLGPLTVRHDGAAVTVAAGRQRALLAALLLNAGRAVPTDELIEVLWDSAPPVSARVSLQNYVKRLRSALGDAGHRRISTSPRGYLISVEPGGLDVERFRELAATARAATQAGSWEVAAARLREALSLWRGEPLADVDSAVLAQREVPRLAEMRLQALEARIEADLHLGRHAGLIAELRHLTDRHPLREHLHGQLMLALYRDGRQAEALAAYQAVRQVLIEELGTEPGSGLRELHQRIMTADPALAADGLVLAAAGPVPVVPRELPAAVAQFTGRTDELEALTALLDSAAERTTRTVVISAIGGTAGVGKTALAVHWAHRVADRFPDGQLYVNLRGYDPGRPVAAADALAGFLRALGVSGQDMPAEETERATRYRSLLAGKRVLVVLDNAVSADQVRPLLPGSPASAVVLTSRDSLAGLVARDGAHRLDLDLLPLADAMALLRALIGTRVEADPDAAATLAAQCCGLPLALRVAAELAADRPSVPLTALAGELSDRQQRLDLLDAGEDPRTAVRAVFSWSYQHLDPAAARTFRLLGLPPGPDADAYAVAALTGATVEQTHGLLGQLNRAHLIQRAGPGRYGLHDLLRAHAGELAATHDGEEERRAALTRLFDHYLYTAAAAMDTLFPAERLRRPRLTQPAVAPVPSLADPATAREWLDSHRSSLVAVAAHMSEHGWDGHATRLAGTLYGYLNKGGHFPEAVAFHNCALRAARHMGDRPAESAALLGLASIDWWQDRWPQAISRFQQALDIYRDIDDRIGQARALVNLGFIEQQTDRYQVATGHLQESVALFHELGDRSGEAGALGALGVVERRRGRYEQATGYFERALALCREVGGTAGEATSLTRLGVVEGLLGRYEQAIAHHQEALKLFCDADDRTGEAMTLMNLGVVEGRQGDHEQAAAHFEQALALYREFGGRFGEAEALNGLGEVLLAAGQADDARDRHAVALSLATEVGNRPEQARAHDGLGRAHQALGHPGLARRHWRDALAIYACDAAPEADQVRAQLAADGEHGQR